MNNNDNNIINSTDSYFTHTPISSEILTNANIGIWSVEYDENQPPRMYADDSMLNILGINQRISPEEIYRIWYDNIDIGSYDIISEAIDKMKDGNIAEVQYPWNNQNGKIIVVRCTGARNFAYSKGIKLEGIHQDVTKVLHLDDEEFESIQQKENELIISKLREESLSYVSDNNPNEEKFIDYVGNKILKLFHCDQVIFFDKNHNKTTFNAPGIESVPEILCRNCQFESCRGNKLFGNNGVIVMNDCSAGYMDQSIHPDCPVKSSIIQQVYADDQIVGWLNVNYIKEFHTFSNNEVEIMKMISAYFGVLLERINHKRSEQERIAKELSEISSRQDREIIEILASEYSSVYYIDLNTDTLTPYTMNADTENTFGSVFRSGITYSEAYKLYVDKLIYSDDKSMMLKAGSIENIKKELSVKKTFLTTYRNSENKYCEMKFVKVGNDNDKPEGVALAFAEKDDQIREEQESKRYSEIANALSLKYDSIYYINTDNDTYIHFHSKDSYSSHIYESGNNFFEECKNNLIQITLPEDRALINEFIDKDHLMKGLEFGPVSLPQYKLFYSGEQFYYNMEAIKPSPDEPHIIIAVTNIDKEVRAREQEEAIRNQNFEIIEILASEYSSVYYIDLTTDALNPYTMNAETETTFGSVFRSGITYSEAYKLYVDKLIYPDDKDMMLKAGSIDNIKLELANKKTFLTTYRNSDNKYSEMKFVKVGGDFDKPIAVALGFAEKDDEIRQKQAAEQERQMNFDIIEILASEYSSVYYIDLTTDALNPYTMNAETETTFGSVFRSGITYSEAYKLYVDKLIFSDDKDMMLKAGSIDNIKHELANKKTFLTTYRNSDNKYSEMKFVKVGGDFDKPIAVALGFAEKDDEIRQEQATEQERQMNFDIIEILASEYSSVYYIDLNTDALNPYTMNAETETTFGSVFRSGITYSEAYKLYVDKLIYSDDKNMMLKAGSIDNIKHELANKKTFLTTYRNSDNKYSEMKFVKVGNDNDEPIAVALGFAEKDELIRQEQAAEQERQMNFDIIEILASEYSSVYYIDLTTDDLNPYTMNEETETTFGSVFRSGITYSEAYRLYVDTLIFPEDKAMMLKAGSVGNIMKELRTKKTFITTYRNSEGHYCEMKFVKVGNEEGAPTAVALGFADKDDELRAKQEEERILQRNIDIIEILASEYTSVYYIDMTTDELDPYTMNEQTETQFGEIFRSGIKYSDAFKMYVDKLVYPDDKSRMLKAGSIYNILDELSNKKTFITHYRSSDGEYCEMKFVKVGDEENPQSVALGFSNKDDEIRAELERKEKQDRDNAVITGLSDDFGCVVYTDFDNYDEIHYRFDPLFEKHIDGWSKITNFKERLDKLMNTIMHPEDRKAFWEATRPNVVREAIEKDGVYFVNFRTLINGEETYYQAKFAKDEIHPETNVIAGFHNVDAETKREMEALDQAKTANKAKTDFLFNMSHDIRTPMNAIMGFTDMAIRNADNKDVVVDSLKKTQLAGELLLSLINNILDMSRIESGKITPDENKADIEMTFLNIEDTMQELAKNKNIDLSFTISDIKDRYIYCDISRCNRILVNLITNAIKYTNDGGYVRVSCKQIGSKEGYGLYQYKVEDNGIGMSEEFCKRAFDEFSRENTATVSGIQGTGLGLSVCRSFVNAMNGTIECKSKQGEGTTFTVTLPFKIQYDITPSNSISDFSGKDNEVYQIDLNGKKVLLVEDNELNLEIGQFILSNEGMSVETANDGSVAVDILKEKGPDYYDFILMDIQMPIMDGYAATEEIRKLYPDSNIPIIAVSANAFAEDKAASIAAGMNDHVAKPINIKELRIAMSKNIKK